jgi:hypothetical protein
MPTLNWIGKEKVVSHHKQTLPTAEIKSYTETTLKP